LSVYIHEDGFHRLFVSETGALATYLRHKAEDTESFARQNAEGGSPLGHPLRKTGALLSHLRSPGLLEGPDGIYTVVLSDATNPETGAHYPYLLEVGWTLTRGASSGERRRYPWLVPALQQAFGRTPEFPQA
jgi:hypothetical protein